MTNPRYDPYSGLVTPGGPPTKDIGRPDLSWGSWGQGLLTEWWETSADLIWPNSVITYGRMRHDPQIKAVLAAYKLPILRATWQIDPTGCRDEVVQQTADDLGLPILGHDGRPGPARRRGVIWQRHLTQAIQALTFGHMIFERRYRQEGQRLRLDNLGARMPWTIARIMLNPADATVDHIVQTTQSEPIPGPGRLVWYANEPEGANWAGISMLRPAFGAWLLKHETWRVHATSIRRFGMGVPSVEAPMGASAAQVQQARDLASSLRVGDQTGVGLPAGFKFTLQGMTGSAPAALDFIRYLDQSIAKMALTGLIELGQTMTGSRSLGETFLDLFLLSLQAVADDLALTATSGVEGLTGIVTDLVDVNWGEDEPAPRIICTDVGDDYEVTANAIQLLVQSGAIIADDTLDEALRKRWGLPLRPPGSPEPAVAPPGAKEPAKPGEPPNATPGPVPAPGPAVKAAALPPFLRRQPSKIEAAAGHDAVAVHTAWESALAALLPVYTAQVVAAQKAELVDQVVAGAGKPGKLANLKVSTGDGTVLLKTAMVGLARAAARQMEAEAATQGVTIDPGKVKIRASRFGPIAAARAQLAGAYLAQQASQKALQVTAALTGGQVGDNVAMTLDRMSGSSLRDQLGAALTAAQNEGRMAVLEAAPASAGTAVYYASEIEDTNTCTPCGDIDGQELGDLTQANDAYPNGGYAGCEGGLRCRGTVVAVWGG